jgi:hypothetical protein
VVEQHSTLVRCRLSNGDEVVTAYGNRGTLYATVTFGGKEYDLHRTGARTATYGTLKYVLQRSQTVPTYSVVVGDTTDWAKTVTTLEFPGGTQETLNMIPIRER